MDLITRLAQQPADRQALVAGDRELSFGELRAEAARVAAALTARGVGPESLVAISLPRGADLVVALLGTLTAGAAYLPVDPALPEQRRRYLVEDARAELVIGQSATAAVRTVSVEALTAGVVADFAPVPVEPDTLAYVIYTSGSTGLPKGVEITRGSAALLLDALESAGIAATTAGRVGWNASASFDASVQQWTRLCRGDTVVVLDDATRADPALMAELVVDQRLTDLDLTPSHADPLLPHLAEIAWPLTLLVGGEPISPSLWQRMAAQENLRAVNLYGPTECTVDATAGWVTAEHEPHIGTVLPGLELHLLDEKLNPVDDGEVGEIHLGGERVARGYRNRPGLTAERFIAAADGSRVYRSGDLARRHADGRLEYLGRRDGQVKVHGHRIELGEIEAALTRCEGIEEAAVLYRDDSPTGPGLVGYYRGKPGISPLWTTERLKETLPVYMVPGVLVAVESFPRTVNGKLDRRALPAPVVTAPADAGTTGLDSPVERLIAEVWSYVLGVQDLSADANFFKLGGHSLLAIKLVAKVRAELGVALPVKAVYQNPRLRDLAQVIEALFS
ncbi:non-ribosomal peptide synthetase [Actinokineospora spheciospongiae]|uniref:non-ribosomal peptide synthetase n=1 Tax=Actinokineospora spheciospongiae TaxID=909613 RepID=UPI000D70F0D7|nr:non-ribosomal peptide synthetase [Actinokineospora spheciospongiae]PWW54813.1 amino acid adenylation domain-containing protein [Actinokineospora spheciospongiae]